MHSDWLLWSLAGIAVVGVAVFLAILLPRITPDARLRRRLRKTHSRIVSKTQRPTVKFSVKTPKD